MFICNDYHLIFHVPFIKIYFLITSSSFFFLDHLLSKLEYMILYVLRKYQKIAIKIFVNVMKCYISSMFLKEISMIWQTIFFCLLIVIFFSKLFNKRNTKKHFFKLFKNNYSITILILIFDEYMFCGILFKFGINC